MGQQRSHLELGTTGRSWPLHGHGRGSVLYGLPREEQCLASACDGSGNTRLEDGWLHIRNTSSVLAGWWVSNPEAFSAVEKKKKNQTKNQPPNTQSYVGSCSMDLPVKIPLLQLFLSVAPPPSHTSGIIPKGHCTGTLHRDTSPPHPRAAGVHGNKPSASSSASKRNKSLSVMGAECHPPGSPPPPASRSPCHKLSTSCQPRAAGHWGGKCSFCAKIKRIWAWGDLGKKHGGAAK